MVGKMFSCFGRTRIFVIFYQIEKLNAITILLLVVVLTIRLFDIVKCCNNNNHNNT